MAHYIKRCKHCQSVYTFQESGHGAPLYNDEFHCPECKEVIVRALNHVTVKFIKAYVKCKDYNYKEILGLIDLKIAEKLKTEKEYPNRLIFHRIYPSRYNMEHNEHEVVGNVESNGVNYKYSWWPHDPEGTLILGKEVERNVETGEEVPWRDL